MLFESASGYALFERKGSEEIANDTKAVQKAISTFPEFAKNVQFHAFVPFKSSDMALENMNDVSEGICNELLTSFLNQHLPKKASLGVSEEKLGSSIAAATSFK